MLKLFTNVSRYPSKAAYFLFMEHTITIAEKNIPYTVKISPRAKRMRVAVYAGGAVVGVVPHGVSVQHFIAFIRKRSSWLLKAFLRLSKLPVISPLTRHRKKSLAYVEAKAKATALVQERLSYYQEHFGLSWGRVTIRNQKTRWGSCSAKGNLNFNYRIAQLPADLADYVIVHELCHVRACHHGAAFWSLVSRLMPDYRERHRALRRWSLATRV